MSTSEIDAKIQSLSTEIARLDTEYAGLRKKPTPQGRARMLELRHRRKDLEQELVVVTDQRTAADEAERAAAAEAERERNLAGLAAAEDLLGEYRKRARRIDLALAELHESLSDSATLGQQVVECFREHCRDAGMRHDFTGIGIHGDALAGECYGNLFRLPRVGSMVEYGGNINRPPRSLDVTAADVARRAQHFIDRAREQLVAEADDASGGDLPPAA